MNKNIRSYPTLKQWILTGFVFCGICFVAVILRLTWLSSTHMQAAHTAIEDHAEDKLIDACLAAVRNHFPGNPYSKQAVTEILQKTNQWETQDRKDEALTALKNLRAALYGIESFYQPFAPQLNEIESQIESLEAAEYE